MISKLLDETADIQRDTYFEAVRIFSARPVAKKFLHFAHLKMHNQLNSQFSLRKKAANGIILFRGDQVSLDGNVIEIKGNPYREEFSYAQLIKKGLERETFEAAFFSDTYETRIKKIIITRIILKYLNNKVPLEIRKEMGRILNLKETDSKKELTEANIRMKVEDCLQYDLICKNLLTKDPFSFKEEDLDRERQIYTSFMAKLTASVSP